MKTLDLESLDAYRNSVKQLADEMLAPYASIGEVSEAEEDINLYPGQESLKNPSSTIFLEGKSRDFSYWGKKAVLEGRVIWEHAAAGEATRLDKGPKFFIKPKLMLDKLKSENVPNLPELYPLELGRRHLIQLAYDIRNLSWEAGLDPDVVLARQRMLVIASEGVMPRVYPIVIRDLRKYFPLNNLWFMTQPSFHGLTKTGKGWDFDPNSPKHLHNHGFLVMQKTMDRQIFYTDQGGSLFYFSRPDFFSELEMFQDLVSYNIEDLDYLCGALDFEAIGLAMAMFDEGNGMMMEILPNNPERPKKGGMYAYDPGLERDIIVESFRLKGRSPSDIKYINKNFNHYLDPAFTFQKIKDNGIFMPISAKDGYLYFQPVQGDVNFITKTSFFTRKTAQPINSLKTEADFLSAVKAMALQDKQEGFIRFVENLFK
jgi:hypothetical protein